MRLLSDNKTGTRFPKPSVWNVPNNIVQWDSIEFVEWKCPTCNHRWLEYSDEPECPEACPLCGCGLRDE